MADRGLVDWHAQGALARGVPLPLGGPGNWLRNCGACTAAVQLLDVACFHCRS